MTQVINLLEEIACAQLCPQPRCHRSHRGWICIRRAWMTLSLHLERVRAAQAAGGREPTARPLAGFYSRLVARRPAVRGTQRCFAKMNVMRCKTPGDWTILRRPRAPKSCVLHNRLQGHSCWGRAEGQAPTVYYILQAGFGLVVQRKYGVLPEVLAE